ncbi:hypothetical protein GW17_00044755 [Ensete ventricosum]|nr:hypothetical protein GW17_00044755 [Ensete ventricosum]
MGKAVPTSATPMAPAIRYVLLSDDSSPTADTATTLEAAGLLPHQGKAGRREGATAAAGGGREEEEEESDPFLTPPNIKRDPFKIRHRSSGLVSF